MVEMWRVSHEIECKVGRRAAVLALCLYIPACEVDGFAGVRWAVPSN